MVRIRLVAGGERISDTGSGEEEKGVENKRNGTDL